MKELLGGTNGQANNFQTDQEHPFQKQLGVL